MQIIQSNKNQKMIYHPSVSLTVLKTLLTAYFGDVLKYRTYRWLFSLNKTNSKQNYVRQGIDPIKSKLDIIGSIFLRSQVVIQM